MTENKTDPLAVIGGMLVLIFLVCPFLAIWIEHLRVEFAITAIWAFFIAAIISYRIKKDTCNTPAQHALIFVEHIEHHLRQWEKEKKFEPNSLKVMCKICNKPIDEIVKDKGAS